MNIWHDTVDAPRRPGRVSPSQPLELTIGTWPIEPGQSVWVEWIVESPDGNQHTGTVPAIWRFNTEVNSYWTAQLGPFSDGDRLTYTVHGSVKHDRVGTSPFVVRVKPALYIAWLWHQHQPLYRDPVATNPAGSFRYPWVRLHALRDYYSMAAIAAECDAHITINLTPVLLRQLDDYIHHGATDAALELTRCPAEKLTRTQIDELLSTFFDAEWHHQIYVHPRYRELFEQRTTGARFSRQDIRDLQMWFNLAWFGQEFRTGGVRLVTGEVVDVHRFVTQQRGFSHENVLAMIDEQYKMLRAIVPVHRELQATGRIEVSTTPLFHPILPLLIDTDRATIDGPGTFRPTRFAHPEDATAQIALAIEDYARRFGGPPAGMWPAEAAVSAEAVEMLKGEAVQWVATDGGVLARSGLWGYRADDPEVLCQPYRASAGDSIALFFRDADVSDGVGFRYGQHVRADDAVEAFVRVIEDRFLSRLAGDADRILTIALDGENAWGGYPEDGRPFLRALYRWLTSDPRVKAVTFSEYLHGNSARGVEAHPHEALAVVHDLATGSWIDEPGSAPGVDLGTWIGESEENAAWNLLGATRSAYAAFTAHKQIPDRAQQSLFAAEGSDWFWWFGGDQESRNDAKFDELFRAHLRGVYQALNLNVPEALDDFIVAHPVVWAFTHPLTTIRPTDRVSIRTNCSGRLTYEIDNVTQQPVTLVPVGGVMAGVRRYQVTLGPFDRSSKRLTFRFRCEHPGCDGKAPCCAGDVQEVAFGRARRAAAPPASSSVAHHT